MNAPIYTTPPAQPAPAQEPVAWMKEGWGPDCGPYIEFYRDDEMGWRDRKEWTPLYTTPPAQEFTCSTSLCHYKAQRTWNGLTHDEYDAICDKHSAMSDFDFLADIEAKFKEKNQ